MISSDMSGSFFEKVALKVLLEGISFEPSDAEQECKGHSNLLTSELPICLREKGPIRLQRIL